jgi:hypothetical protein
MLPVAQLYARDVPGLRAPAGADLLQVLWCGFDHAEDAMPRTVLFWRSADSVTEILTAPPEPEKVQRSDYVPEPCTLDPEQVTEYPVALELDSDLREQVELWCIRHSTGTEPDIEEYRARKYQAESALYDAELSVAPGWKVGGWTGWGLSDPYDQPCPACGTPTEPLLTIAGSEWDAGTHSWVPYEDQDAVVPDTDPWDLPEPRSHQEAEERERARNEAYARQLAVQDPTGVQIGRGYNQVIRTCPASPDHPHVQLMQ